MADEDRRGLGGTGEPFGELSVASYSVCLLAHPVVRVWISISPV